MTAILIRLVPLFLLTVFFPLKASATEPQDQFTLILPAPAIHQAVQAMLPLPLEPDSSSFNGKLSIDSIDKLTVHEETIALHGIVSGKNLTMNTEIAGQAIKLKLGQVTLPLSCDLHLRFDQAKQQLFITPQFKPSPNNDNQNGEAIFPLLAALGNREHLVELEQLLIINPTIGNQNRPLRIEPVQVTADNNQLILKLRPQKIN